MKKLLISAVIAIALTVPTFANTENLFAGAFAEEHLKAKNVPFAERFIIISCLSLGKELIDNNFSTEDLTYTVSGQMLSLLLTEIGTHLENFVESFNTNSIEK